MSLITCPECGKKISCFTSICNDCGFPLTKLYPVRFGGYYRNAKNSVFVKFYSDGAIKVAFGSEIQDGQSKNKDADFNMNDDDINYYLDKKDSDLSWQWKDERIVISEHTGYIIDFDKYEQYPHRSKISFQYTIYKDDWSDEIEMFYNNDLVDFTKRILTHTGEAFTSFDGEIFHYQAEAYSAFDVIIIPEKNDPFKMPIECLEALFLLDIKYYQSDRYWMYKGQEFSFSYESIDGIDLATYVDNKYVNEDMTITKDMAMYMIGLINDPRISWTY